MTDNLFEPALVNGEYFYTSCINPFFYEGNDKKIFDVCLLVSSESVFSSQTELMTEIISTINQDEDFSWLTTSTCLQWSVNEIKAVNSYEEYQAIIKLVPHHTLFVEQNFC